MRHEQIFNFFIDETQVITFFSYFLLQFLFVFFQLIKQDGLFGTGFYADLPDPGELYAENEGFDAAVDFDPSFTLSTRPIPEPSTLLLLATGLLAIFAGRRLRARCSAR